ncbi:homoserine O-acetyltransferase MetX [Roseibium litorale]|uniref:Probable acyltransferase n=1 Tax=Roseibium litorale TaxID=2803841 RepID=A0ABR9CLT5_9HYPH|nr:homoserine O-acetyltransferase [Roseibium litorale]MBD8891266.1 homoserine O-acetyltransferase [Roseibium litorale]
MLRSDPEGRLEDRLNARPHLITLADPLQLQSGAVLPDVQIACQSYGHLNEAQDNAVLVLHGLTSDQHAAGASSGPARKPGWWNAAIGPGKAIDTDRYFVIVPNVLGGAGGTTSPAAQNPSTGRPYGLSFPVITLADMAKMHAALLDALGIEQLHATIGGCLGGFQVLEMLAACPARTGKSVIISATARTSAHNTALWAVLRAALMSDPNWRGGDYYNGPGPSAGLGLLAMTGALFWMSRETLERRFGIAPVSGVPRYTMEPDFAVEQFLNSVKENASKGRLDANSLIYLTRAIDYFDLARDAGSLQLALKGVQNPVLLVSYASDWRYPVEEMAEIAKALPENVPHQHLTLESTMGHGAFLYEFESLRPALSEFLR